MVEEVEHRPILSVERLKEAWATWWSSLMMLPLCVYFGLSRGDYIFMDAIDLAVHEAGHLVFAMFGEFIRMAGGTLLQLLIPMGIAAFYLRRGQVVGTQLGLLWLGQSCINVSVYAADARTQALPLVGGPYVLHDWHYMLRRLGMLEYDAGIGMFLFVLGIILFVVLLTVPRWAI